MQTSPRLRLPFVATFLIAGVTVFGASKVVPSQPDRAAGLLKSLSAPENYGNLPLVFEPNDGQVDPSVRFLTHTHDMTVYFTDNETVMVLHKGEKSDPHRLRGQQAHPQAETAVVRMKLAGAGRPGQVAGLDKLPGLSSYFIGNDPAKWRTNIPNYARIQYQGVYPGVDLVCYGKERQLEYDLVVAPGADPRQIELAWEGIERLKLNAAGDLVLATRLGDVVQKRPRVYQEIGGRRVEIAANYALHAGKRVGFDLARYDRSLPLVIDPVTVVYGTYLGASGQGSAIAVDSTGAAYVTGYTYAAFPFPLQNPYQSANLDVNCSNATTWVTKLAPGGNALAYSTYLGGSCEDDPNGIAVDAYGAAYIVGTAWSHDFPMVNAFQTSCPQYNSVFVTKISPAGNALGYSTYLCGGYSDYAAGIAVDSAGSAYVTGQTASDNWPVQVPYQLMLNGSTNAFVTKLSPAGNSLVYSTYLGGSAVDVGTSIAIDGTGAAYIAGWTQSTDYPVLLAFQSRPRVPPGWFTGFVTKLSPAGTTLVYSTYLGGSGEEKPLGIALDAGGAAFLTGVTYSTDFPLLHPVQSTNNNPGAGTCFVTKLGAVGNVVIWSTYLGGSYGDGDFCYGIAADNADEAYVTGITFSPDFPVLLPYQANIGDNSRLAFATKFSAAGTLVYSTFLGGNEDSQGNAIAVDSAGAAYLTGSAGGGFPVPNGFQRTTGNSGGPFVAKLQLNGVATTVVNSTPTGLDFTVDGTDYINGQSFTWTAGSSHTIGVNSPQTATRAGTRYAFANWSDSGQQTHTITASSSGATYTASFTAQYLLSVSALPSTEGVVTENPISSDLSGYYSIGTSVSLGASPNDGYAFSSWGGDLSGSANPQSVSITAPMAVTANFVAGLAAPAGPVPVNLAAGVSLGTGLSWSASTGATSYDVYFGTSSSPPLLGNVTVISDSPGTLTANTQYYWKVVAKNSFGSTASAVWSFTTGAASAALRFVPMTPCRVVDTRNTAGPIGGGSSRDFNVPNSACGVPSTAQAYSLNVAVVPATTLGYLTLWPTGQTRPLASTLNSLDGRIKSNAAIVPAGTAGAVSVFASDTTQVILDINGYFIPANDPTGLAFYPIPPCRIGDTRTATALLGGPALVGGQNRTFPILSSVCNLPATAKAYSLNFAAVPGGSALGYLTAWPTGQSRPLVASLNAPTGTVTANAAIVPAGTNGSINVFASDNTNLVIDINGYFAPMSTGGLSLYNVAPCRVADTRQPPGAPPVTSLNVAVSASACGIPATAQADVLSVTVVPPGPLGYLTLWPQGQAQPLVSTLNALDGAITSNMAIVPTTNGSISGFPSNPTHVVMDISGYFGQ
jgi:hypothetical protein